MTQKTDSFADAVSDVMSGNAPAPVAEVASPEVDVVQAKDRHGVTHTLRDPELCVTFYPAAQRLTLERGPNIEEERTVPIDESETEGAEDVAKALVAVVALKVGQIASQHNRQIIRVEQSGIGSALSDALSEAGFYVIPFSG